MTKEYVVALMESSKSITEWNANCDTVKRAFGAYPDWWYSEIMLSGLAADVMESWSQESWKQA